MVGANTIRCDECGKKQPRMRFSNNQLKKFEDGLRRGGTGDVDLPKCRSCTGEPATSLECYGCGKELPLTAYARQQRKNKDKRLCPECSQRKQDREADIADAVEEEREYNSLKSQAGGEDSVWYGSVLPATVHSSAVPSLPSSRVDDGLWVQRAQSSRGMNSSRNDDSDEDETGSRMGMSMAGSTRSNETWAKWANSNAIEHTYGRGGGQKIVSSASERGWHKQGAVKMTAKERAQKRLNDEAKKLDAGKDQDEQLSSDRESDDSDDFEM